MYDDEESHTPSILFIDAYDSFTHNIISLLATSLACKVRVIHIDSPGFDDDDALLEELSHYDAVVCGPGPGNPANEKDVGIMSRIWKLPQWQEVPTLGVCLGFQSLCHTFRSEVKVLNEGLHGRVRRIEHIGEATPSTYHVTDDRDIFQGVGRLDATLYHSLFVDTRQNHIEPAYWWKYQWDCVDDVGQLIPLAWVVQDTCRDKSVWKDDKILMAVRHVEKPFWGLQYHPESVCTGREGEKVIQNWFRLAQEWNKKRERRIQRNEDGIRGFEPRLESLLSRVVRPRCRRRSSILSPLADRMRNELRSGLADAAVMNSTDHPEASATLETFAAGWKYGSRAVSLDGIGLPTIIEELQASQNDFILFDSTNAGVQGPHAAAVRGRYSIIALDVDDALQVEYRTGDNFATVYHNICGAHNSQAATTRSAEVIDLSKYGGIFSFLAEFQDQRQVANGVPESPFWGGWMGYTTYEFGLETIDVDRELTSSSKDIDSRRPDLCFAWVTRSVVLDHQLGKVYIQELSKHGALDWLSEKAEQLEELRHTPAADQTFTLEQRTARPKVTVPGRAEYEHKVRVCQSNIALGESYELCLTDQTTIRLPKQSPHPTSPSTQTHDIATTTEWQLYKTLRTRNPAPFASFLRLGGATFVSASPERFLKWDEHGKCELRPMKGTVKKASPPSPAGPDAVHTLAEAEALLKVDKEQAENLMIVDLVRHDLHSVCGPGNVEVPRLMVVEEYETVFQMISVVEGRIPQVPSRGTTGTGTTAEKKNHYTGIDVLAASLPPGSMTGAPKKRSCEILRGIEGRKRGLYSGVVGYMDVGGRGDFSVNIRCMFRWDDEADSTSEGGEGMETWHLGAGGAVTALSTPEGEAAEMRTKLLGTLRAFEAFGLDMSQLEG